jgi:hypothetical protein
LEGGKNIIFEGRRGRGKNTIFEGRRGKYGFWTDIYIYRALQLLFE